MKHLFQSGLAFIKENPRIIYSLVLLVFVPGAFFFNTYSLSSGMEQAIDRITQRKAVLAERIINTLVAGEMENREKLQQTVDVLTHDNTEILSLAILWPDTKQNSFRVVASSEPETLDQTTDDIQYVLAWNKPEGIAYLARGETGRFWRVTHLLQSENGDKLGLVAMTFSLQDSDVLIESTVNHSYLVLLVTVIIVLLLVSNQARLFGHVLALSKLKEVDAMKDNLVSMASHELRSPLTAIKGYLELLQDKKLELDDEAKKYFDNISHSVDRLNILVKDMLEVSRLEGNRIPLSITEFDPLPLISQSIEELRSQAMEKNLVLSEESPERASVSGDQDRVREILINLIGNAIKYTATGSVTVTAKKKDKEYLITVADTGFGISAEDQKKLFQKFARIQNAQTKTITGTGLGLWITKELAEKMGGTITLESIEGVGSHFTFHLPLTKE